MVLVDTAVWSLALGRRKNDLSPSDSHITHLLYELIRDGRVSLLGSIRQELLSGIREESQFRLIRGYLHDFPNIKLESEDYEDAARISNICRRVGITGSPVDMMMCSVSLRNGWEIFTTDQDFAHYKRVVPIRLLNPHP